MTPAWLHVDLTRTVESPVKSLPGERSAAKLREVIDAFDVEHAERYRVRDVTGDGKKETFCNFFVSDVTRALFAEIPHEWQGRWQDVHAMHEWILSGLAKWSPCESWFAQVQADKGFPVVAIYDPPGARRKGHIAMLVPSEGRPGVWIAQAGMRCYRRAPLLAGFGMYAGETHFYSHE